MKRTIIIAAITMLNVVLFLYTGIEKMTDYELIKEQLSIIPLFARVANPVAWLLPLIELAVVVLLITPRWRLKGFYSSMILMAVFTFYLIATASLNKDLPCSCGGVIELLSWKQHLFFNGGIMLLIAWAIALMKKKKNELRKVWNEGSGNRMING